MNGGLDKIQALRSLVNFAETQLGNFVSEGWFDTQLWIQKGPEICNFQKVKDLDFLFFDRKSHGKPERIFWLPL